jgi:6-phosphogluconolactonase
VVILVAGSDKRDIFDRLRRGDETVPAARLQPIGTLCLFSDAAAAGNAIP